MRVAVYGLQRSGTNYVEGVLMLNFECETVNDGMGWKHAMPHEIFVRGEGALKETLDLAANRGVFPVVVKKDLDHWLASIERDPKNLFQARGPLTESGLRQLHHRFYKAWAKHGFLVRYEDFIEDFKGACQALSLQMGVPLKEARPVLEPTKVASSPDWEPEHKARYLSEPRQVP